MSARKLNTLLEDKLPVSSRFVGILHRDDECREIVVRRYTPTKELVKLEYWDTSTSRWYDAWVSSKDVMILEKLID